MAQAQKKYYCKDKGCREQNPQPASEFYSERFYYCKSCIRRRMREYARKKRANEYVTLLTLNQGYPFKECADCSYEEGKEKRKGLCAVRYGLVLVRDCPVFQRWDDTNIHPLRRQQPSNSWKPPKSPASAGKENSK